MKIRFFVPGLKYGPVKPLFDLDLPAVPGAGDIVSVNAPEPAPGTEAMVGDGRYVVKAVHWRIEPTDSNSPLSGLECNQIAVECEPAPTAILGNLKGLI